MLRVPVVPCKSGASSKSSVNVLLAISVCNASRIRDPVKTRILTMLIGFVKPGDYNLGLS